MKLLHAASLALALTVLASCGPTKEEFEVAQTTIQGSPALQKALYKDCVGKTWSKSDLAGGAMLLSVPPSKVPALTCKRLVNALVSGRLKYADVRQNMNNGAPTVNLIKILQGR
ncbi:hypothetical protein [Ensifer sp.]|uniref:hypothetical protein n=1 Tax=Ensifer sp. TaxID=1872086 RepID=UPI002E16381B|nr:hypothetical protein [Ensifer sp.]